MGRTLIKLVATFQEILQSISAFNNVSNLCGSRLNGENSIVAAGAVVNIDVPDNTFVAGVLLKL